MFITFPYTAIIESECNRAMQQQSDDSSSTSKSPVEQVENSSTGTVLLKDEYQPGRAFYILSQLRRRHQFCDVQVFKDAACFSAHRVILAASSPYFMSLLQSSDSKETPGHITLTDPGLTVGALEMLIDFMYTSMLRIKENTVETLCYASRLLQLSRIEKACCKFIINNLNAQNCFRYLNYAEENNYPQIKIKCLEHAPCYYTEASNTDDFLNISFENLSSVVQSANLTAKSHEVVLESVLRWVNHDSSTRQNDLYPLLQSIKEHKFPLQSDEKVQEILNSPRISTEQVVRSLKACFEKLQLNHDKWQEQQECRETPSGESDNDQHSISSETNTKTRRKVHFESDEDDSPSKLPESERRDQEREDKPITKTTQQGNIERGEKSKVKKSCLKNSVIVAAGGVTANSNTNSVEKYDVKKKNWAAATALPQKKSHAALVNSGENLYSIGGYNGAKRLSSVDVYNAQSDKWSSATPMPTARSGFGATVDKNGHVYCIGGYSSSQQDLNDVDMYDPEHDQWTPAPPLNQRRSYLQAATLGDNIYALGGTEGNTRLQTVEKLSPYTSAWNRVADMNIARSRPGVASLDGHLFVMGGYNGAEHLSSVECYSPNSDCWRMMENMSVPRNSPATAVHDGCLYVAGGHSGKTLLQSVERYDPHTKKWSTVAPMNTARCDFGMTALGMGDSPPSEIRKQPEPVGTWI